MIIVTCFISGHLRQKFLKYFRFFLNTQSHTRIARDVIPVHSDRGYCIISKRTHRSDNRNMSLDYFMTYTQDKYRQVYGHSFPRDFYQGRTFVLTSNDHPGHSCSHQMTTPDIRAHIKLPPRTFVLISNYHPGHSFT